MIYSGLDTNLQKTMKIKRTEASLARRWSNLTAKTSLKRKGLQFFVSKMLLKNNDLYLFYKGTLRVMFTQLCTNVCFVFILFYSFVYFQYARTKQ